MIVRATFEPDDDDPAIGRPVTGTLSLQFTSGRIYDFDAVPIEIYQGLLAADSPGQYYHQNIRDQYS